MWFRFACVLMVVGVATGCTTTSNSPATTPSTTSTVALPTSSSTTTTAAPTTTVDRIAEIEAIFLDLEIRRLQAIKDQDEGAYRSVFANEFYEEASFPGFSLAEVVDPEAIELVVDEVLVDSQECIVAAVTLDRTGAVEGGGRDDHEWVAEFEEGRWGLSYVGSGWRCEGPHPLAP